MTDRIPVKIRCIAAIYHLIFAIAPGWLLIATLIYLNDLRSSAYSGGFNLTGIINIFMELMISCGISFFSHLLCKLASKIHPFIGLVGREAIKYNYNRLVILIVIIIVIFTINIVIFYNVDAVIAAGIILYYCTQVTYFINSVVCGIFALRGHHFKNKFICPFN